MFRISVLACDVSCRSLRPHRGSDLPCSAHAMLELMSVPGQDRSPSLTTEEICHILICTGSKVSVEKEERKALCSLIPLQHMLCISVASLSRMIRWIYSIMVLEGQHLSEANWTALRHNALAPGNLHILSSRTKAGHLCERSISSVDGLNWNASTYRCFVLLAHSPFLKDSGWHAGIYRAGSLLDVKLV